MCILNWQLQRAGEGFDGERFLEFVEGGEFALFTPLPNPPRRGEGTGKV